jgi:hypothetical protein
MIETSQGGHTSLTPTQGGVIQMTHPPSILETKTFGAWSRYKLIKFANRFGGITYFVHDAEQVDEATGLAKVIRQADTEEAALGGLA